MNKKLIAISVLVEAILFVSVLGGMIFYYNVRTSKIASLNNEIANLNNEEANLTSQISNLNGELTNLTSATSAYLVTALGIIEVPAISPLNVGSVLYNHLYISGSVTNIGKGTAVNAGLHVVAYDANGDLLIDMTVPLDKNLAAFGTDAEIDNWLSNSAYGLNSLQLGILGSGQTATINLGIFHEGTVTNWTVTPVWTNSA
jgi:hypothetical protein